MDPTLPSEPSGDHVPAPERSMLSSRLELVAALITGVVGLEVLALIVGLFGGPKYQSVGSRLEVMSLNLDARLGFILLIGAMLATLRNIVTADFDTPRSDLGQRTLIAIAALGGLIAVLSLIGVGLDIARTEFSVFGNTGAAVIHRLAVVLMAGIATGWALAALGVRVTTRHN